MGWVALQTVSLVRSNRIGPRLPLVTLRARPRVRANLLLMRRVARRADLMLRRLLVHPSKVELLLVAREAHARVTLRRPMDLSMALATFRVRRFRGRDTARRMSCSGERTARLVLVTRVTHLGAPGLGTVRSVAADAISMARRGRTPDRGPLVLVASGAGFFRLVTFVRIVTVRARVVAHGCGLVELDGFVRVA